MDLAPQESQLQAFVEGMRLVREQMWWVFGKRGLERLEVLKKPFNPEFHEAFHVQSSREVEVDTVVEELRPGYRLAGRLLRPSRVRVAGAAKRRQSVSEHAVEEVGDEQDHRD